MNHDRAHELDELAGDLDAATAGLDAAAGHLEASADTEALDARERVRDARRLADGAARRLAEIAMDERTAPPIDAALHRRLVDGIARMLEVAHETEGGSTGPDAHPPEPTERAERAYHLLRHAGLWDADLGRAEGPRGPASQPEAATGARAYKGSDEGRAS